MIFARMALSEQSPDNAESLRLNPAPPVVVSLLKTEEVCMYVWSKKLVIGCLAGFVVLLGIFLVEGSGSETSILKTHTTRWMALNYVGLVIWVFVWMIDQARVRGRNVWVWLVPFLLAPLPTLMALILFLQRPMKSS